MWILLNALAAFALTTLQIAWLAQFPPPFQALSFPLVAIALCIMTGRPLTAVVWAVASGLTLDLHGLFGFGAETLALVAAFFGGRFAFERFLTSGSASSSFLLVAVVVTIRWSVLGALDGLRVIFGETPYVIDDPGVLGLLAWAVVADALAVAAVRKIVASVRAGFARNFLSRPHAQRPLS